MSVLPFNVRRWLVLCASAVFIMVIIGGITRLTDSGLSITHWSPIHGIIPPLNELQWQEEFKNYQASPEYQKINKGMELSAFKNIFFWEYLHRLWGRVIGLLVILPLGWFLVRKQIPASYRLPLCSIVILVGLQGVIGWWMVKSGLVDKPDVSHYRLAVHLGMAFVIFALCLWFYLPPKQQKIKSGIVVLLLLYIVTAIYGAFVAGLKAGLIYNQFPYMGTGLIPSDMWFLKPWWYNLWHNEATIQFIHRWFATGTWLAALTVWLGYKTPVTLYIFLAITVQAILGIATLVYGVPLVLGVLHQANAAVVLGFLVWGMKENFE